MASDNYNESTTRLSNAPSGPPGRPNTIAFTCGLRRAGVAGPRRADRCNGLLGLPSPTHRRASTEAPEPSTQSVTNTVRRRVAALSTPGVWHDLDFSAATGTTRARSSEGACSKERVNSPQRGPCRSSAGTHERTPAARRLRETRWPPPRALEGEPQKAPRCSAGHPKAPKARRWLRTKSPE